MAISLTQIETLVTDANTALAAGDYNTALVKATSAQAMLSLVPDAERPEASGGSFQFDRRTIGEFIDNVRNLKRENTCLEITPIELTFSAEDPTCCGDDYA